MPDPKSTTPRPCARSRGSARSPPTLTGSALLMIDLQNTYREGIMRLDGVEPALAEAAALLARARAAGIPVIHVRHDAGRDRPTT